MLQHTADDAIGIANVSTDSNPDALQTNQSDFDELLSLFTSDPSGWTWQPADTAIESQTPSSGLPPWVPHIDQQLDAWMPMFSNQTQQYQL